MCNETQQSGTPPAQQMDTPFSLLRYILIVFVVSWPPMITGAILGTNLFLWNASAMMLVAVGTWLSDQLVFHRGFTKGGWRLGRPWHYATVVLMVAGIWILPVVLTVLAGDKTIPRELSRRQQIWIPVYLFAGVMPAFGEEFGWRGYMLSALMERWSPRLAVVIHGVVWWLWHLPFVVGVGLRAGATSAAASDISPFSGMLLNGVLVAGLSAGLSLVPAILHAALFAGIWARAGSVFVATIYHAAFDGVRDSLGLLGLITPLAAVWSVAVVMFLGAVSLWKVTTLAGSR